MEDFIANLAAQEGWTDATTAKVLASTLQSLVDMGGVNQEDLEAIVLTRGGVE